MTQHEKMLKVYFPILLCNFTFIAGIMIFITAQDGRLSNIFACVVLVAGILVICIVWYVVWLFREEFEGFEKQMKRMKEQEVK